MTLQPFSRQNLPLKNLASIARNEVVEENCDPNTGGPRISRFFGGKKIPHYAKPRYAGTIYSTSLVLKTAKRGKLFFKVHFLSIFSYLELCIAHQIDAIFNANSNLVSN